MSKKRFEQSMGPREHIERALEDAGISHPSEWRNAFDSASPEEKEVDKPSLEKLLTYLEGGKRVSDKEKRKQFSETGDSIERLKLLRTMSLGDAIICIRNYSETERPYRYLAKRLDFYQKFIQGRAMRKKQEQEWDNRQKKHVDVIKEYPIDASEVSPETIRLGILRDLYYAAMQGTPEMGAVKIATKRINEDLAEQVKQKEARGEDTRNIQKKIRSVVEFWGYYSGVDDRSFGQYTNIIELYQKCREQTQKRFANQGLDEKQLEHKAVLLMAKRLQRAYGYLGEVLDISASPYNPSLKEAVAAGQLGYRVMRQMRGMRNKIQETNFERIERFIGKSGDNRYASEKNTLATNIEALKEFLGIAYSGQNYTFGDQELTGQEAAKVYTEQENNFAIQKQQSWYGREAERLNHKLEKQKENIEKAELPEEEKKLQFQSITERHQAALAKLQTEYEAKTTRLGARTSEQLLADLKARQTVVNERFEKRKSLAQKALDLHFRINHTGGDDDSKPLAEIVDWINYAPFGTINRAHKMMRLGASDEQIVEYALADIIAGKRGATREDLKTVGGLVAKTKGQDWAAKQELEALMRVGNILSISGYKASLDEVADLAGKSFSGMAEALKMYDLEQVKQFMNQRINLQSITAARKITQKFGHDLSPVEIAEIASHNINGLEEALRSFDLDETRTLLKQDVHLPAAVAVLNNTRQCGYELKIGQIVSAVKNIQDVEDFISALRELTLVEVEKLLTVGVPYRKFNTVRTALKKHGYASDFASTFETAKKLIKHNEYDNLGRALDVYSLAEVDQIVKSGTKLAKVLDMHEAFQEIRKSLKRGGIDTVIAIAKIAKNNSIEAIEVAAKTIEAGFTVDEIIRFPFLISRLVTKK